MLDKRAVDPLINAAHDIFFVDDHLCFLHFFLHSEALCTEDAGRISDSALLFFISADPGFKPLPLMPQTAKQAFMPFLRYPL